MKDSLGREIDYMRISLTDRCNLRCAYCMPEPRKHIPHSGILRYEEFLRICRLAIKLGITNFKVTGGEPLIRRDVVDFITKLKRLPGVASVSLTTNGILLEDKIEQLKEAGIDGVNISLDALTPEIYKRLTGFNCVDTVKAAVKNCVEARILTKLNAVLLEENESEWEALLAFAEGVGADIRFIELMPIGYAQTLSAPKISKLMQHLRGIFPDLYMAKGKRGNGPAVYYKSKNRKSAVGFIAAYSAQFCADCNRVRLTSIGQLKPCLCYGNGTDLRTRLRGGATDFELTELIRKAIYQKPAAHCFYEGSRMVESRPMNRIGG